MVDRFNDQSRRELEGIRDFIVLHYHLTERQDSTFWDYCRTMEIPDTLAQRMALFEEGAQAYQDADELFRIDSWVQVMLGQGLRPSGYHRVAQLMPAGLLREALASLKANIGSAVGKMPTHQEFLREFCR